MDLKSPADVDRFMVVVRTFLKQHPAATIGQALQVVERQLRHCVEHAQDQQRAERDPASQQYAHLRGH